MMNELAAKAIEKFRTRSARIGIIGLGYAGLPLACCFAEAGFETSGFDVDLAKVTTLNTGKSYIRHIESSRLTPLVRKGMFRANCEFDTLASCDAAIICVPTPLGAGRTPDLSFVIETSKEVARYLRRGQLIALESTSYPGTTDEILQGIFAERGMKAGSDYFLAFSPEREDPGNRHFDTRTIPKLVGGVTPDCLAVASAAYGAIVERVVPVSSARVAEADLPPFVTPGPTKLIPVLPGTCPGGS